MFQTALWSDALEHLVNQEEIQCDQICFFLPFSVGCAYTTTHPALYNCNV